MADTEAGGVSPLQGWPAADAAHEGHIAADTENNTITSVHAGCELGGLFTDTTHVVRRDRFFRALILDGLLPHPGRLRWTMGLLRFGQRLGLRALARHASLIRLLMPNLADVERLLPVLKGFFPYPNNQLYLARGKRHGTVSFFSGCMMPYLHGATHLATVRVLQRNGFQVLVPAGQSCCGFLYKELGEDATMARLMARRNVDAFLSEDVEAVIVNSVLCGMALKGYGDLLQHDPIYAERAREFVAKVRDVSGFLMETGLTLPRGEIRARAIYVDGILAGSRPMAHVQPISLLAAIPGLELVDLSDSARTPAEKVASARAMGAHFVATDDPTCMMQMEDVCRRRGFAEMEVVHIMDLLDMAYRQAWRG